MNASLKLHLPPEAGDEHDPMGELCDQYDYYRRHNNQVIRNQQEIHWGGKQRSHSLYVISD